MFIWLLTFLIVPHVLDAGRTPPHISYVESKIAKCSEAGKSLEVIVKALIKKVVRKDDSSTLDALIALGHVKNHDVFSQWGWSVINQALKAGSTGLIEYLFGYIEAYEKSASARGFMLGVEKDLKTVQGCQRADNLMRSRACLQRIIDAGRPLAESTKRSPTPTYIPTPEPHTSDDERSPHMSRNDATAHVWNDATAHVWPVEAYNGMC